MHVENKFELVGKLFNGWTVLKRLPNKRGNRYWLCQCKCGRTASVPTYYLTKGYSTKCLYCAKHTKDIYKEELPKVFWNKIKWNAKRRKMKVVVSREEAYKIFLNQDRKCNLTGMSIRLPSYGTDTEWTASLDRIDSSKGYTIDNVQWVHKDVNRIKNIFSEEYFVSICQKVAKFCKKRYNTEDVSLENRRKHYTKS